MNETARALVERTGAVEARLVALAERKAPGGLTEPDQPSGERWDWGQVWAHVAEFPAYWLRQLRAALAEPPGDEPPPFGRTKADAGRIDAIERDRAVPAPELLARLRPQLDDLRALLRDMTDEDWSRTVRHSTLGELSMPRVMDEFLVGHLEAHAAQLEALLDPTLPLEEGT
jgi:DinB superfamily